MRGLLDHCLFHHLEERVKVTFHQRIFLLDHLVQMSFLEKIIKVIGS
jgi:hypothetical protein